MESRAPPPAPPPPPATLRVNALTFERVGRFSSNLVYVFVAPKSQTSSKIGPKKFKNGRHSGHFVQKKLCADFSHFVCFE